MIVCGGILGMPRARGKPRVRVWPTRTRLAARARDEMHVRWIAYPSCMSFDDSPVGQAMSRREISDGHLRVVGVT